MSALEKSHGSTGQPGLIQPLVHVQGRTCLDLSVLL